MAAETTLRGPVSPVVGAFLLPPLTMRAILFVELDLSVRSGDLLGIALDLSVSLLLAMVALLFLRFDRWGRFAASALVVLWCLINFANFEHIRELGAMARMTYAGFVTDPTFLLGSGLVSSHPVVFSMIAIASCLAVWFSPQGSLVRTSLRPLLVAIVIFGAFSLIPFDRRLSEWRQTNLVVAQAGRLIDAVSRRNKPPLTLHRTTQADLSGDFTISRGSPASNVLLIILEGVSGAYLPSLRDRHGETNPISMPHLDRIAQTGLSWSTFINHQRQTNRGEYAILCGDYPKLFGKGQPKMTELIGAGKLDCLPTILRESGFTTAYLQAAPMSFMLKDQFMPQAGFETAHGDPYFNNPYHRNHWGVDDLTFFEQSVRRLQQLREKERPWFLTLLTVGTHHPFNAPHDFRSDYKHGSDGWAMDYLDRAVGYFIQELDELGVLNDTLVIITSDESREKKPHASDEASMLSQSWGFLIVLTPAGDSGIVDAPFVQLDLPISILDYLDLSAPVGGLGGRSVFRRYESSRNLLWGNTYLDMVAGLSSTGELVFCDGAFRTCRGAPLTGSSLYSPDIELTPVDPSTVLWLQREAEESESAGVARTDHREFSFIKPGSTPVLEGLAAQLIFGGQFLTIPAGVQADIEIVAKLVGPKEEALTFSHDAIIFREQQYIRTGRLGTGQTVSIQYTVVADSTLNDVEFRFWVDSVSTSGLEIVTIFANIRLSSVTPDSPPNGLTEYRFQISDTRE